MAEPSDLEARVSALENHVSELDAETRIAREDAAAARHLAAARDRDLADLTIKIDANRSAISALGVQTRGQFDQVDRRFDAVDRRFDAVDRRFADLERRMTDGFAATKAGLEQIVGLLDRQIDE